MLSQVKVKQKQTANFSVALRAQAYFCASLGMQVYFFASLGEQWCLVLSVKCLCGAGICFSPGLRHLILHIKTLTEDQDLSIS